jgi:carbohydrate-selective porin OprB
MSNALHLRRKTMLRKVTLALVAAASLSAMALAPSAASAKPWGGGWGGGWHHHHWGHGFGFGVGYIGGDDGCYQTRRVLTPYGVTFRTVNVCAY